MQLSTGDIVTFGVFIVVVVGASIYASRREESTEDYFLAGRGLRWWLIGISLVASNISSEHFVGMSGEGYSLGLAIASYEWIAAIALVFVALVLLPRFLRLGIYTIPEYLEHRYGAATRAIMAFYLMVAYVVVAMAGVLYSGALALREMFGLGLHTGVWGIGLLAGLYTVYGGLKAVVWSDLIQGIALLLGGAMVTIIALGKVGGLSAFLADNAAQLHTILPSDHPKMPWTIFLLGIWIPNLFYWGLNQFITQRALAARSLAHGQRGVLFAALLKLFIPFIVVFPGIMARRLYGAEIPKPDQAYPYIVRKLLPDGVRGVMFAALFGAVMSSLDSMLNSASTIFTIDLYKRHFARSDPTPKQLVRLGRVMTALFVVVACLWAPALSKMGGVYAYMQMVWGFISPGICAVFVFGLIAKEVPGRVGAIGLLGAVPIYGVLLWRLPGAFLNAMGLTFLATVVLMAVCARVGVGGERRGRPSAADSSAPVDLTPDPLSRVGGAVIVALTLALYVYFR